MSFEAALEVVAVERRRCVAEREAFGAFRSAILAVTPAEASDSPVGPPGAPTTSARAVTAGTGAQQPACGGVGQLRKAYRRTVMGVDHYEEEYDDPIGESVESELGPDVRALFTGGTFTPAVKRTLLERVDVAVEARESFVSALDDEADSLTEVRTALEGHSERLERLDERPLRRRGFEDLLRLWHELEALASALDELATARQRAIKRRSHVTDVDATAYLFDGYPALDAIATLVTTVDRSRRLVERALTTRA